MRNYVIRFVALYLIMVIAAFIFQRDLLYFPHTNLLSPQSYGLAQSVKEISLAAKDGTKLTAWWQAPITGNETFIFYHGNAGHLGRRTSKYQAIIDKGYGLLALSYRGFGTSEGAPTEQGLYQDARAAIKFVQSQNISNEDIIIYGESLGTAIAVQMALEQQFKLIALEAPFSSIIEIGQRDYWFLPVSLMLKDRYESDIKIAQINDPLIIFHGDGDRVVPIASGMKLFSKATGRKKAVYYQDIGHNNQDFKQNLQHIINF